MVCFLITELNVFQIHFDTVILNEHIPEGYGLDYRMSCLVQQVTESVE